MSTAMNLTQAGTGINPVLSGYAQGYQNSELVGSEIFPNVPTPASAGKILQFDKEGLKLYNLKRAPGAAIAQIDLGYSSQPFALEQVAAQVPLPRETIREAQQLAGVDLQMQALELRLNVILLDQEYSQATLATTASNYASGNVFAPSGSDLWSDPASNPIKDVLDAREVIRSKTGRYPNKFVISAKVFATLQSHPALIDRLKYTSAASVTTDMLANWFRVSKVVIGGAVYSDDAGEMFDVWGAHAILATTPEGGIPGLIRPSFGYNYVLNGHPLVENPFYDQNNSTWKFNIFYERNAYITSKDAGFLFSNVVA